MIIKSFIADKPTPIKSSLRISFKRIYNLFNGYIKPSAGMLLQMPSNPQLVKHLSLHLEGLGVFVACS